MEVWCGIIVGFDNDDQSVFAAQRRFVREARIVSAIGNMLVAIPRTPLYKRLASEGRLDLSDDAASWGSFGTNVIPRRISREALCAGYIDLMRDPYALDAHFRRLDELYLDGRLQLARSPHALSPPSPTALVRAQCEAPRRSGRDLRAADAWYTRRGAAPRVPTPLDASRLASARTEDHPDYAVKCAMHYHAHRMVQELLSRPQFSTQLAA